MDLAGLRQNFNVLSEYELKGMIGCGNGTFEDPYTEEEFFAMMDNLNEPWKGGYVSGWGFIHPEWTIYNNGTSEGSYDSLGSSYPDYLPPLFYGLYDWYSSNHDAIYYTGGGLLMVLH